MNAMQPSFYQWRKKVSAALAMDASRVHLSFTGADGRSYSIEPEELQHPHAGTYTARLSDGKGGEYELSADYDPTPDRPGRRSPEDAIIGRYERMADDLERARQVAENRARTAEAEKLAALDTVNAQQRRIHELEVEVDALKRRNEGMFDEHIASLLADLVAMWTGGTQVRGEVAKLLRAIERDPRAAERIAMHAPEAVTLLAQCVDEGEPEA